jgi:hypothetical protein
MGLSLNKNNAFTITDSLGNTKFSLNSKMPHIIHEVTGNVGIPALSLSVGQQILTRIDTLVTLADTYISTDNANNFIFPLIKITGGVSDTGGKVLPALGSTVLRTIKDQATNSVLGTSVLDCIQDQGSLKFICTHNFDRGNSGFAIGDDAVTISYRVYYGRFN